MPQMKPLVLKDAADPTVSHTFKPRGIDGGVASFVESVGVPLGDRRITYAQSRTQTGRVKITVKMSIPVVQNAEVNGVSRPTVVRTAYADCTFSFDAGSTALERASLITEFADGVYPLGVPGSTGETLYPYFVDLEGWY